MKLSYRPLHMVVDVDPGEYVEANYAAKPGPIVNMRRTQLSKEEQYRQLYAAVTVGNWDNVNYPVLLTFLREAEFTQISDASGPVMRFSHPDMRIVLYFNNDTFARIPPSHPLIAVFRQMVNEERDALRIADRLRGPSR
jgi:hypothetical protein